jgi:hypothetical protein
VRRRAFARALRITDAGAGLSTAALEDHVRGLEQDQRHPAPNDQQ